MDLGLSGDDRSGNQGPGKQDPGPGSKDAHASEQCEEQQSEEASAKFVRLLTDHQQRLRAYLIAMVRSEQQSEDLLQETNMALWRKRSDYDHSQPFFSWACGMAFIEVLRSRRKIATEKLRFDAALLESISEEAVHQSELLEDRKEALRKCLRQLNSDDFRLIESRYSDGLAIEELCSIVGRPPKSIYKALGRIRESLYRCIERSISHSQQPRVH